MKWSDGIKLVCDKVIQRVNNDDSTDKNSEKGVLTYRTRLRRSFNHIPIYKKSVQAKKDLDSDVKYGFSKTFNQDTKVELTVDASLPHEYVDIVEDVEEVEMSVLESGEAEGVEGKAGGVEGKAGGVEWKDGGVEGKAGGVERKAGGVERKAGGVEKKAGGVEGKTGGVEGKTGGVKEKTGGVEEKAGGGVGEKAFIEDDGDEAPLKMISVEFVTYGGSFAVLGDTDDAKSRYISHKLQDISCGAVNGRKVLLVVSLAGVKVCQPDGKTVLMGHALRRISYATCDPQRRCFSFLARQPQEDTNTQYCHTFLTASPQQAEELKSILGHAFRLAYAAHLQKAAGLHDDYPLETATALDETPPPSPTLNRSTSFPHSHSTPNTTFYSPSQNKSHLTPTRGKRPPAPLPPHVIKEREELTERGGGIFADERSCLRDSQLCPSNCSQSSCSSCSGTSVDMRAPAKTPHSCHRLESDSNSSSDINSCRGSHDKPSVSKIIEDSFAPNNLNAPTSSSSEEGKKDNNLGLSNDSQSHNINCSDTDSSLFHSPQSSANQSLLNSSTHLIKASIHSSQSPAHSTVSSTSSPHHSSTSHCPTPPPLPQRFDSLTPDDTHLKAAAWFQAGIPREIALEVLSHEPLGAFLVRESSTKPGCYALSLRVPSDFATGGIAHYLIVKTNKGYRIKGFTKDFPSLRTLITHHSVMPELLPVPLLLTRHNPAFNPDSQDKNEEDPDYSTLSDFRKMMADLNV